MNILVTGGAGYIGSHACKTLAAKGYTPVSYDNLSRGNGWAVNWGPLEKGDIADTARLRAVLEKHQPVALMHFAAYAYVPESVAQPLMYYTNNAAGSAALLKSVLDFRCIPVVFSSTCATYGLPERVPISEDHPQRPINPYGYSKLFVERMLADLHAANGLPWIALRYFNAAGADPGGEIGEAHDPETHLIPLVAAAARTGEAVRIFGTDYDTPDGTCVRDYVHVSDIADAHVRALEHLLKGGKSCALNLANARGYSVKEVVAAAGRVCGRPIRTEIAERRPGDPPVLIGDASQARALLGWQPARSDLELQIGDAWNWMTRRK
ncbi:MAG: UDP-glucose 4-epimerase GalE [Xanthobacteraceae bacterium]